MFSGIVEATGRVEKISLKKRGARLLINAPFSLASEKKGDSIAVNGCCITLVSKKGKKFEADLSHETLRLTNLGRLRKGERVNLERPIRLGDRIGGHLVQGHVDGVGKILSLKKKGRSLEVKIGFPRRFCRYIIPKGSIAVDGISMTVHRLEARSFTLVVIPHTLQRTNLGEKRVGGRVNLEVDLIGKYLSRQESS